MWANDDPRLSAPARRVITGAADALLSIASCWEVAIKVSRGRLTLPKPVERFFPEQLGMNRVQLLQIDLDDGARVAMLPHHHGDPFNRLLAAQALGEDLKIVSADPIFT